MTEKLSFFDRINFDSMQTQSAQPNIKADWLGRLTDSFLAYGDKEAVILKDRTGHIFNVMITEKHNSEIGLIILHAFAWLTVVTPILLLIGKAVFRYLNSFEVVSLDKQEGDAIHDKIEEIESKIGATNDKEVYVKIVNGIQHTPSYNSLITDKKTLNENLHKKIINSIQTQLVNETIESFQQLQSLLSVGILLRDVEGRLWILSDGTGPDLCQLEPADWGINCAGRFTCSKSDLTAINAQIALLAPDALASSSSSLLGEN